MSATERRLARRQMKILVCGGRDWRDAGAVNRVLMLVHNRHGVTLVIEGGARGADAMAREWATAHGVHTATVAALWRRPDGTPDPSAGPRRNRAMLLLGPDAVIAFPGGAGTGDMVRAARAAGVRVWEPLSR